MIMERYLIGREDCSRSEKIALQAFPLVGLVVKFPRLETVLVYKGEHIEKVQSSVCMLAENSLKWVP